MIRTGLEFAPGTTPQCKRIVTRLFQPEALLSAYRAARDTFRTTDIVLVASDQSPDIAGGTRWNYAKHLKEVFGRRAAAFGMWDKSAHSVMKLPAESEAMWLVVDVQGAELPVMCVVWAMPFKTEAN